MERRRESRYPTHTPVEYSVFSSRSTGEFLKGEMEDYSELGMNCVFGNRVSDGTILLVRTVENEAVNDSGWIHPGFKSLTLAEVKWSKSITIKGSDSYTTGLRHL